MRRDLIRAYAKEVLQQFEAGMSEAWTIYKEYRCEGELEPRYERYYQDFTDRDHAQTRLDHIKQGNEPDFFNPQDEPPRGDEDQAPPADPDVRSVSCWDTEISSLPRILFSDHGAPLSGDTEWLVAAAAAAPPDQPMARVSAGPPRSPKRRNSPLPCPASPFVTDEQVALAAATSQGSPPVAQGRR